MGVIDWADSLGCLTTCDRPHPRPRVCASGPMCFSSTVRPGLMGHALSAPLHLPLGLLRNSFLQSSLAKEGNDGRFSFFIPYFPRTVFVRQGLASSKLASQLPCYQRNPNPVAGQVANWKMEQSPNSLSADILYSIDEAIIDQ